jgi:hypothetical protein
MTHDTHDTMKVHILIPALSLHPLLAQEHANLSRDKSWDWRRD